MNPDTLELIALIVVVVTTIMFIRAVPALGPVLNDLFRGGPRPPTHPLLGDDSNFLTRRRSRQQPSEL
jgi:hypothetical protein